MTLESRLQASIIQNELLRLAAVADEGDAKILRYAATVLRLLADPTLKRRAP